MEKLFDFFEELERLKRTPRSGWMYYGIKNPETVAEHSFMVAVLAYIFGTILKERGEKIDVEKAIKMALIHELGETRIGDLHLKAREYLGECVKKAELKAVEDVTSLLDNSLKDEIIALYREFEEGQTAESRLVKAVDKVELLIQAHIYTRSGHKNLEKIIEGKPNRTFFEYFDIIKEFISFLDKNRGG